MSEGKKEEGSGLYGNAGIIAVGGVAVYKIGQRILFRLSALWHVHPWLCVFILAALGASLCLAIISPLWNKRIKNKAEKEIVAEDKTSVYLGRTDEDEKIHLKQQHRTLHADIIGPSGVGKTESTILPWSIRDLETGAGLLIIDGKSDKTFLEKFYAYVVKSGRSSDFRLFSLADSLSSSTFNPLMGGTSYEVAERVFSSFTFENEYFRNVQYMLFHAIIRLIIERDEIPTFALVRRLLTDTEMLGGWLDHCEDNDLRHELGEFLKLPDKDRTEKISGLDAQLSHFATGELAQLFNATEPQIKMDQVLRENLVCYFQLPSMYMQQLASATGRLVLQGFQNAVSKRHLGLSEKPGFFSCYLDDFQDYIYEGFGALLNKARSANVGVVFSHQSLGDLDKVSPAFKNIVLTNTSIKCVMRNNDPDTCEYFSKSFGTQTSEKVTERQTRGMLGHDRTGDGSVREVEEFRFHPNQIRALETGEGIVSIPHFKGVKVVKLRFKKREDIAPLRLPRVLKEPIADLSNKYPKKSKTSSGQGRVATGDLKTTEGKKNETNA